MSTRELALRFFISQALVWIPMILGHQLRRRGLVREAWANPLHAIVLIVLSPIVSALGVWKLDRSGSEWWRIPMVYGLMLAGSGAIAFTLSPRLFRDRRSVGTHLLLVTISNIGHTMAGFLTLLLIGVAAYPYNCILSLPSCMLIYLIWLPAATRGAHGGGPLFGPDYWRLIFSPLSMPLVGVFGGLGLNFAGVPMGRPLEWLMQVLVFLTTALTMFAIGWRLISTFGALPSSTTTCWLWLRKPGGGSIWIVCGPAGMLRMRDGSLSVRGSPSSFHWVSPAGET